MTEVEIRLKCIELAILLGSRKTLENNADEIYAYVTAKRKDH